MLWTIFEHRAKTQKDSLFLTELLMYGEKRLGVINENRFLMKKPTQNSIVTPVIVTEGKPPAKTNIYPLGKKHYETTDWLGNVRVTYTDKKSPGSEWQVCSECEQFAGLLSVWSGDGGEES
ncbi:MAG: hypothetical protein KatS3mg027_2738 [Bacteroidia bacterium]|nr:MAG: hypothetical protein KatS3mg027_2738 [Bacteroidia bacterium]